MQSQGLPSQLGVRPAPELTNRFLTQSFGWMFAAVLITAVVAVPVLGNEAFLNWAYRSWLLITIATFALGIGVQVAISRVTPLVGLLLFFVYAAALGVTVAWVSSCHVSRLSRRSSARRRCSAGRRSTARRRSATSTRLAGSCSWA
jgi:FtsH-binding integral membrane protein